MRGRLPLLEPSQGRYSVRLHLLQMRRRFRREGRTARESIRLARRIEVFRRL